jgi:serine/threonine protein kinase
VEHAVKFCTDPLAAQILQRERDVLRELLGQLQTAQIVSLEQSNFAIDPPYLAFTFCPGGDLVDWISRRREKEGRVPVAKALLIIQQVAQGLAAAHKLGIVHRDMKPGNILLDAQGQAVITDFGLGRIGVENNLALFSQMAAGVSSVGLGVAGTPLYMPPEIRQGRIPRDDLAGLKKGDVYALGVTAFQLFLGDVEAEPINVRRQLNRQQVPESVIDLIEDCISPSNERPPDAVALALRLQPVVRPVNPPNLSASATVANLAKAAKSRQNTPPTPSASTQADIVAQLARIAQSSRGELPESPAPRPEAEPDNAIDPSQRAWAKLNNIGRDLWQKIKNELL